MARKVYEEEKIRAIGDKIREKTGGTTTYKTSEMPTGIDEVYEKGYMDGGGGGTASLPTQEKAVNITENGTTEVVADEGYALSKVTVTTNVPDDTTDEDAIIRRSIKQYSNDRVVAVGGQAFYGCSSLTFVHFAKAESVSSNSFRGCTALATAIFDKLDTINANTFNGCSKLSCLILGGSTVCKLGASTSIASTAIADGNGYAYVRPSLVEETRVGSNWSAIAEQIMPLVSTVEGLADIDGTTYDHACVWAGGEEFTEYYYNGTDWEVFTR